VGGGVGNIKSFFLFQSWRVVFVRSSDEVVGTGAAAMI